LKNYIACNLSDRLLWGRVYLVGKAWKKFKCSSVADCNLFVEFFFNLLSQHCMVSFQLSSVSIINVYFGC
jgi:hypothetical protein